MNKITDKGLYRHLESWNWNDPRRLWNQNSYVIGYNFYCTPSKTRVWLVIIIALLLLWKKADLVIWARCSNPKKKHRRVSSLLLLFSTTSSSLFSVASFFNNSPVVLKSCFLLKFKKPNILSYNVHTALVKKLEKMLSNIFHCLNCNTANWNSWSRGFEAKWWGKSG